MSSFKILVVARSTTAHTISGGMEKSFEQVAEALYGFGHRVSLLTTSGYDQAQIPEFFEEIWEISGGRPGRYSLAWWVKTAGWQSKWLEWNPDLVLSVSTAAGSLAVHPKRQFPIIAQSHGTAVAEVRSSFKSLSYKELLKIPLNILRIPRELVSYRLFDRTIAIGESVEMQLRGLPYLLDPQRIELIPNGTSTADYAFSMKDRAAIRESLRIPPTVSVALYIGRLHYQKGVDIAIKSFARLLDKSTHLILVGAGSERATLESLATTLGVRKRVHFTGKVESTEIPAFLSAADTFVFPTRRKEGLPLNVLEALASGMEVITVPDANLPEPLKQRVHMTTSNVNDFARTWSTVKSATDRGSKLPDSFTAKTANSHYLRAIDELLSEERKK